MESVIQWFDPSLGTPVVTVSKTGLTFNPAAVALLDSPAFVEVGVDPKAKALVVRPVQRQPAGEDDTAPSSGTERALPFRRPASGKPRVRVTSRDLIRFIEASIPDFTVSGTERYLARFESDAGYLVVDLKQPLRRRRRRKTG